MRSFVLATGISLGLAIVLAVPIAPAAPNDAASLSVGPARLLSAAWGLNDGNKCPTGQTGHDNIPVTFNWFIENSSIAVTDFAITRGDGITVTPTCVLQYRPNEINEA